MHNYKRTEVKKELKRYVKNSHVCSVCGLDRSHMKTPGDEEHFIYFRSGISFSYEPECVNDDIENNKTID